MPKFIFTADWHIRPDRPVCRLDGNWLATQESQVDFVIKQVIKHKCPLVIGGDIFHKPQIPDNLKNMLMLHFVGQHVYAIAGNHCAPYHSFDNINDSSFGVLFNSGVIDTPPQSMGCYAHFGQPMSEGNKEIVFLHEPIFASERDCPPNMKARTAEQVLAAYPDAKWIFCGDIHTGFHYKQQGRHLIMAGCLNRQVSNSKDYEPKIWLIDTDNESIEEILVPDDVSMVTENHIQQKIEREDRISAFITMVKDSKSISLDFESNVKNALVENRDFKPEVKDVITELMNAEI